MENLDGKYFERVIGELQKAKAKENYVLNPEFKSRLRADLVARAELLVEKPGFDWNAFLNKWKYAFGAVPTLAILTVVAFNFANNKVVVKQTDFMPVIQNTGADMLKVAGNDSSADLVNTYSVSENDSLESAGVKTFSAALALPPAEFLEQYKNGGSVQNKMIVPTVEVSSFSFDSGTGQDVGSLKISDPKLQTFKFDFGSATVDFSVKSNVDNFVENVNSVQVVPKNEVSKDTSVQLDNANVNTSKFEESGRVESSGVIISPVQNKEQIMSKTVPVQEESVNKVVSVDQPKTVEPVPSLNEVTVKESPDAILLKDNKVVAPTATEYINPQIEMTKLADYYVPANTLMNQAMSVQPNVFAESRVKYEGEDRDLIVRLVSQSFVGKTDFAPDYYIKVEKLLSGNLKISLFEYGYISKVIFLSAADGFKVVTELRY